ncbi:sensor histidine kinase [Marinobacter nanhaiticus D15-8W]|uniref:Sensor histidine kinase n=1 Tax=Marinobacter nanhaiticus D15-8W TaxID=626887 RepID=N6VWS5_9GAMM|nr:sensor histidine kinase [Marinobacter nanhaiticus]ENO14695.1 sensor histidine kinase [Marinobacter nanhaiticus D15-8W]BES69617.1 sensor histidine kinase [Marinobacter nanhaiticus D15-8W]
MPPANQRRTDGNEELPSADFFVPDLCRVRAVFLLLMTSELIVLLLSIVHADIGWIDWHYFGLVSLFVQWTVLTSAALICSMRRWLRRFSNTGVVMIITAVVLLDVLVFTVAANGVLIAGDVPIPPHLIGRNLLAALIITLMVLRYFFLQHQWRQQKQAEMQSRMTALQARIHPHFLFNSMNTIASLIASRPEQAEDAVLDLSELFRASLRTQDRLITLGEELTLCQRYLHIEALRLGDRLTLTWDLDPALASQAIPPLTLQPLVENAIYHGIQPRPEGGEVRVHTYRKRHSVYIEVQNPERTSTADQAGHRGNRIALANIRARLDTVFDEQALLKHSVHEGRYTVTLRLPWRTISNNSGSGNSGSDKNGSSKNGYDKSSSGKSISGRSGSGQSS